jgi:hypothetical protein
MNPYRLVSGRLNFFEKLTQWSYSELFLVWILTNAFFAFLYFLLSSYFPANAPTIPAGADTWTRVLDSMYFSMVTATTIGYGDIVPLGISKLLAVTQSTSALLIFAVLVGKLVARHQDATLHEVHRMTFEGVFYHIRHVLFIVRKDLDELIEKAHAHKRFDERDWNNLTIAYLQAHSLVEEIPGLYTGHGYDLHNVDLKHEKLLFEGVHRTLQRIFTLLDALDMHQINWRDDKSSMDELQSFIDMVDGIMLVWRERSPFHEEKEFEDIRVISAQVHEEIKERTM